MGNLLPDPKWDLTELLACNIIDEQTLFIGCVSSELRSTTAITNILNATNIKLPIKFIRIEDDQCTFPLWKERSQQKTNENWHIILAVLKKYGYSTSIEPINYKMSIRREEFTRLAQTIKLMEEECITDIKKSKIIVDFSSIPSYFGLRLLRELLLDRDISNLIILYTKPENYPTDEFLKVSPLDISRPEFLPGFGSEKGKINWIVSVGFDYDSVKCAERIIGESIQVVKTNVIIPFPGYKPEYIFRSLTINRKLIQDKAETSLYYCPADNPFNSFKLIKELKSNKSKFILSSFGPKPMAIGIGLAAIFLKIPILHVQATNYNPDFSSGESNILAFWIKFKGRVCCNNKEYLC